MIKSKFLSKLTGSSLHLYEDSYQRIHLCFISYRKFSHCVLFTDHLAKEPVEDTDPSTTSLNTVGYAFYINGDDFDPHPTRFVIGVRLCSCFAHVRNVLLRLCEVFIYLSF